MKKEGLVCSENLTHNPSIYGGKKYMYHIVKTRFCHSISVKGVRKDSTAAIRAGGRLGITKFGILSPMKSHWQHSRERNTGDLLPSRKKASAMPGETSGQD